ncbi:MAG: hypothetical protein ACLRL4_02290 [Bifidobacterium bifidum]
MWMFPDRMSRWSDPSTTACGGYVQRSNGAGRRTSSRRGRKPTSITRSSTRRGTPSALRMTSAFPRIADAVNTLCGSEYKRFQESWFVPSVMRQWYGDRYRVWFPKLAIGGKAVANGWKQPAVR